MSQQPLPKDVTEPARRGRVSTPVRDGGSRAIRLAACFVVGALYFWLIGIGYVNERFVWDSGLDAFYGMGGGRTPIQGSDAVNGYYDLLARAFAQGRVRLPVDPPRELLALRDPWSDAINRPFRLLDAVLYRGHYYLYHGATPALLVFTPWYVLTGHDFPENFAAFLFAFGGYLFVSAIFVSALSSLSIRLPFGLYALVLVALGVSQCVPFLLHRTKVYEVAIACGFFCLSSGFYFILKNLTASQRSPACAALAGLSFGLAAGCRPHLVFAAAAVLVLVVVLPEASTPSLAKRFTRRDVLAFAVPVLLCGLGIAAYNYLRFGNPLEFGTRYLLGGDLYRNFRMSASNLLRGLYYLLVCPPDLVPEFPFFRLALREPLVSASKSYFLEPISGALCVCPLAVLAPMALIPSHAWKPRSAFYGFLAAMFACISCTLFVIAAVPFTSQRYEVDFLPYAVLMASIAVSVRFAAVRRKSIRAVSGTALAGILLYGVAVNLALAIQGPFDQFVQASPATYVKLARWFSPVRRFRPLLNPGLHAEGMVEFVESCPPRKEPLFSAGEFGARYLLSVECAGPGRIRLVSESSVRAPDVFSVELPSQRPGWHALDLDSAPDSRMVTVSWDHRVVLRHPLRFFVTSPSQLHFGRDPSLGNRDAFEGRIVATPPRVFP